MKLLMENWRGFLKEGALDDIAQELGIELRIYERSKDILVLSKIIVPEELRSQGIGSIAMKKITQYADQNNKIIALTPSGDFGGNKNKLIKFYKQFGFVMNKGRNKNYETQEMMIREPNLMREAEKACKPSKGKRFAKRVDGKCRSYGQSGQAKDGGDRIRPGTKKGDAYCARSAKIKKCKNPPCANDLSRKKWKCKGDKSVA